jgi:hypothetical protein
VFHGYASLSATSRRSMTQIAGNGAITPRSRTRTA